MNKLLIISLFAALCIPATAQNRSVNFEKLTWEEAVAKAKRENKLVFVDLHAVWCAECKVLEREVFAKDEVADYHNANFVNVDYDIDEDEDGRMFHSTYAPKAYPTVLYIDPNTREEVSRKVGVSSWERFLEISKAANDPSTTMKAVRERYEQQGERDEETVLAYFASLYDASLADELQAATAGYYGGMSDREFVSERTFGALDKYAKLLFDPSAQRLIRLKDEFYKVVPRHEVDNFIRLIIAKQILVVNPPFFMAIGRTIDPDKIEELIEYLKTVDMDLTTFINGLYLSLYDLRGDYENYLATMKEAFKFNMLSKTENGTVMNYFSVMLKCEDKSIRREAYDLLMEQSDRNYYAPNVMQVFEEQLPLLEAKL